MITPNLRSILGKKLKKSFGSPGKLGSNCYFTFRSIAYFRREKSVEVKRVRNQFLMFQDKKYFEHCCNVASSKDLQPKTHLSPSGRSRVGPARPMSRFENPDSVRLEIRTGPRGPCRARPKLLWTSERNGNFLNFCIK